MIALPTRMSDPNPTPPLRLVAGEGDRPPDEELVARAAQGDGHAFEELVRRYQAPVFRIALRFARDPDEADDLAQRTFIRALSRVGSRFAEARPRPVSGAFRSWVFRIAANLSKNHLRDRARLVLGLPIDPPAPDEAEPPERRERARAVREAIARLPLRQRQVATLRVDAELGFAEIASALRITENNAKVCFHLAVRRLRERLGKPEV